jgi:hypothetical protein
LFDQTIVVSNECPCGIHHGNIIDVMYSPCISVIAVNRA